MSRILNCPFCGCHASIQSQNAPKIQEFPSIGLTVFISCESIRCKFNPSYKKTAYLLKDTDIKINLNKLKTQLTMKLIKIWNKRKS